MNAPKFNSKAEAEAAGYVVDTCCYPWIAYQGPRFAPTLWSEVPTDTEAELRARVAGLEAGLREVEQHHVYLNRKAYREESKSETLRIVRRALLAPSSECNCAPFDNVGGEHYASCPAASSEVKP